MGSSVSQSGSALHGAPSGAEPSDRVHLTAQVARAHADMWLEEKARALAAEALVRELVAALRDCLGWHDFADDLHKPIEVRAAYMRARAALAKALGREAASPAPGPSQATEAP